MAEETTPAKKNNAPIIIIILLAVAVLAVVISNRADAPTTEEENINATELEELTNDATGIDEPEEFDGKGPSIVDDLFIEENRLT